MTTTQAPVASVCWIRRFVQAGFLFVATTEDFDWDVSRGISHPDEAPPGMSVWRVLNWNSAYFATRMLKSAKGDWIG